MIYVVAALGGAAVIASAIAYAQTQRIARVTDNLERQRRRADNAERQASKLRHVISRMEAVSAEAAEEKRKHRVGSEQEQFDSTLDILGGDDDS